MFESLMEYKNILVTGPQRSGTRICAQMIASDTGHTMIDETQLSMDSLYELCSFLESDLRIVVQCPVLCRNIHILGADDTLIVLMRRKVEDILASQRRIHWRWEWLELGRYDRKEGVLPEIKYEFWEKEQKKKILHYREVDYESLSQHQLWKSKEARIQFSPNQTSITSDGEPVILIGKDDCPLLPSDLVLHETSETETLLTKKRASLLINSTGSLILQSCDGTKTVEEISIAIADHFEMEKNVRTLAETRRFLWALWTKGFLTFKRKRNSCNIVRSVSGDQEGRQ